MTTNINLTVIGLDAVKKTFNKLLNDSDDKLSQALNRGILVFDAEAAKQTPVDSGLLRNTRAIVKSTRSSLQAEVVFDREYAAAVHDGTRTQRANPYATRAVEIKNSTALDIINDTLSELIT